MCYEEITCPRCSSLNIKKNGITRQQKQRFRCKVCGRQFLTHYTYRAYRPEVQALILSMTLNSSGIRDTARLLGISIGGVLAALRRCAEKVSEPRVPKRAAAVEVDEFWSFVGTKEPQRWMWYAFDRRTKQIIAYHLGRRTDESCRALLEKLRGCGINSIYTDRFESYNKLLPELRPKSQHVMSKRETRNIERRNMNFRTHIKRLSRRTICFSKSVEMHDLVVKLYVNYSNQQQHHF